MSDCWDSFAVGTIIAWEFSFSKDDVSRFSELSKDSNPLHFDMDFAIEKGFCQPILFGGLLASQLSRLVGEELFDQNSMLLGYSVSFKAPAFSGCTYYFNAVLEKKTTCTGYMLFEFEIVDDLKTIICNGKVEALWKP